MLQILDVQPKESKSEEGLVDPADHDACILLPVLDVAIVGQGRSHVPSQQTPAHSPDQSQKAVDCDVEVWLEPDAAVQDYGESKCGNGEEGRGHELHVQSARRTDSCVHIYVVRLNLPE